STRELSEAYGVSRPAIREALLHLQGAGIIDLHKGRNGGASIREANSEPVVQSFSDLIDFGRVSLEMLLEARLDVMDDVVALACKRATYADFAAIRKNIADLAEITASKDYVARSRVVIDFYILLAKACQNEVFVAIV